MCMRPMSGDTYSFSLRAEAWPAMISSKAAEQSVIFSWQRTMSSRIQVDREFDEEACHELWSMVLHPSMGKAFGV